MDTYELKFDRMTVGYHGKPLIRDISIGIKKGQIVTMIGPNGAGKSTILKSVIRQLALIGGKVLYEDRDMKTYSFQELSSRMAVILTDRVKTELMTCRDVTATGRYPYTGRLGILSEEDERKVDEALETVHASELGDMDFNAISDGQRQRVLLARAICQEPDLILLDEPTSFLDIRHKLELLGILRDMAKKKGITILMSLHEIDLAMKVSDRILCVKGEYVDFYGEPDQIFQNDRIQKLYEIRSGYFDTAFGSIELPAPKGIPKTLVISAGGTGIPVYRRLQREGKPFIAGILYKNDLDYHLAKLLAAEVITEEPFEELSDMAVQTALTWVQKVEHVLVTEFPIGSANRRIHEVLEEARKLEKLQKIGWKSETEKNEK